MKQLLCLALCLLAIPCLAEPLVVISIDGLNPEFYQSQRYDTPNLKALARGGAWAEAVYPVFPSFTYPNHTALVTGCRPDRHGIHTNIIEDGPNWFWESHHIKVPTLWQAAKAKGLRVAMLSWPVSVGAEVDFLIPEVFQVEGIEETTRQLLQRHSTSGLMERFAVQVPDNFREWDIETTRVAKGLLQSEELDLMLIHFIQVDKAQHNYGPEDYRVGRAIARVDKLLGELRDTLGPHATIAVVGDHGFQAYTRLIRPKAMLEKARLHKVARVKTTGGSAAVYTESDKALDLFRAPIEGVAKVLEEEELRRLGAFPGARLGLVAKRGYVFSKTLEGPAKTPHTKGQHGYLPEQVPTGLIIYGPGLAPGTKLGRLDITQVAPTLAHLLGVSLPTAQGRSFLADD